MSAYANCTGHASVSQIAGDHKSPRDHKSRRDHNGDRETNRPQSAVREFSFANCIGNLTRNEVNHDG